MARWYWTFVIFCLRFNLGLQQLTGQIKSEELTTASVELLKKAVSNDALYDNEVISRVCIYDVVSVRTQVVQGLMYRFEISGCIRNIVATNAKCNENECVPQKLKVKVWQKPDQSILVMDVSKEELPIKKTPTKNLFGVWEPIQVTEESRYDLEVGLSAISNSKVDLNVCFERIVNIEEQLVANVNRKYRIEGCKRESWKSTFLCERDECNRGIYDVSLFIISDKKKNTKKISVSNIVEIKESTSKTDTMGKEEREISEFKEEDGNSDSHDFSNDNSLSVEDKEFIDNWIRKQHLNKYGDPMGTVYLGGSPLFDEQTGKMKNLYSYFLERHPNRPWSAGLKENVSVEAKMMTFETSKENLKSGYFSLFWLFGIFGSILLSFLAKLVIQRWSRGNYEPLETE